MEIIELSFKKAKQTGWKGPYSQQFVNHSRNITAVQPLLGPTGLVYYLRFRYSSNKGFIKSETIEQGYFQEE